MHRIIKHEHDDASAVAAAATINANFHMHIHCFVMYKIITGCMHLGRCEISSYGYGAECDISRTFSYKIVDSCLPDAIRIVHTGFGSIVS